MPARRVISSELHALRARARGAFTLIELIAVMILVGTLAVAAAVSFASIPTSRQALAARRIEADLSFARERAMATGLSHWVVFNTGSSSYSLLAEDPQNPGRAGALAVTDPATGASFVQRLNFNEFAGVTLVSVSADAAAEIGFNWKGEPLNAANTALAANATVTVSGTHQVITQMSTGMVSYDAP